ncbi:hypothetical protein JCM11491_002308 [Sporobolomyces phaffii]
MVALLPLELLCLVVDNFHLPAFSDPRRTFTLERASRSTLYSLCLTSHTFRDIAQPILFAFVGLEYYDGVARLSTLIENNRGNNFLSYIRSVVFAMTNKREMYTRLLSMMSSADNRVDQLVIYSHPVTLQDFSGMHLTRLFLASSRLELGRSTSWTLPNLEVLGLYDVDHGLELLDSPALPSLRHLVWDHGDGTMLDSGAAALCRRLSSLDSITLVCDIFYNLPRAPSIRFTNVLVSTAGYRFGPVGEDRSSIVHMRVTVTDWDGVVYGATAWSEYTDAITRFVQEPGEMAELETVYLPSISTLPPGLDVDSVRNSISQLVAACQRRKVEIVFEGQSEDRAPECQVSEEFMRRMTRKRLDSIAAGPETVK